jgi:hypothetical protein
MITQAIKQVMQEAMNSPEQSLEFLKNQLTENGLKHCVIGVRILMGQLEDIGLEPHIRLYYETLAAAHLPYSPADIV